ncbi:MAG: SIMPL domain-containing protein [Patescibacteria group bacterium]
MDISTIRAGGNGSRLVLLGLGIVALTAVVLVAILRDRIVNYPQWQISVTGRATVPYESDEAKVTLGVNVDTETEAAKALTELNTRISKVLAAIEKAGVLKEDIATQSYTLQARYEYVNGQNRPVGYTANQLITITIKQAKDDTNRTSGIIAAATAAGANQVFGISFSPSNLEELRQQARLAAIADAKTKAGAIASGLGVRLRDVVGWWENPISVPGPTPYYGEGLGAGGGGGGSPIVPAGVNEIVVEVNLNYRLK